MKASTYADDASYNDDQQLVVGVDWYNAVAYCLWAKAQLPTEAQWEYAARGPEGYVYPWENDFDGTKLNYCDENCTYEWADKAVDDGYRYTAPVGFFPEGRSWVGALDMAGNVFEWTADWYGGYSAGSLTNPEGTKTGSERVVRGGSQGEDGSRVRSAYRGTGDALKPYRHVGFRCVVMLAHE
ncbi:MAG: formylglycine-generating enzyme family protein [Anaerolineae bacterium]|nr:formylglycine-generating enzyme family protein [Anaerolineae bacterium]